MQGVLTSYGRQGALGRGGLVAVPVGSRVYRTSSLILREYLPNFAPRMADPLTQLGMRGRSASTKALDMVFEYLSEVSDHGTSGALYQKLEAQWNKCGHRTASSYDGNHGSEAMAQLFVDLGRILSPHGFWCNDIIFSALKTFFTRHFEEMIAVSPLIFASSLRTLDKIELEMPEVIACLTQRSDLLRQVPPELWRMFSFSSRLMNALDVMLDQKLERRYNGKNGGLPLDHPGRAPRIPARWSAAPAFHPAPRRRGPVLRPILNRSASHGIAARGDQLDPDHLKAICLYEPDRITIDEDQENLLNYRNPYWGDDADDVDDDGPWADCGPFGPRRRSRSVPGRRGRGTYVGYD